MIFTSLRTDGNNGNNAMAEEMDKMAKLQAGFLGAESARNELGITVSYWQSLKAIRNRKANTDHLIAQKYSREKWCEITKSGFAGLNTIMTFNCRDILFVKILTAKFIQ